MPSCSVIKMLGKTISILCITSFIAALLSGNMQALGNAVIDGAARAVTLTLSLLGIMCLWCGVMRVLKAANFITKLSKLIAPLLKILFPTAYRTGNGLDEISANISANILGIGNAATPFAIKAMEALERDNPEPGRATDDMITLAVLNTASINLLPTTLLALRRSADSSEPAIILVPVWICSAACTLLAVTLARSLSIRRKSKIKHSTNDALTNRPTGKTGVKGITQ